MKPGLAPFPTFASFFTLHVPLLCDFRALSIPLNISSVRARSVRFLIGSFLHDRKPSLKIRSKSTSTTSRSGLNFPKSGNSCWTCSPTSPS